MPLSPTIPLSKRQRIFTQKISLLIAWAYAHGYELTVGDAFRDPRVFGRYGEKKAYSARFSAHKHRLAIDFNLFKDDTYLTRTEDHLPLGEYWESIGGTWGGRFNDGNHYSWGEDI